MTQRTVDDVTCLGCGCACDDIRVVVRDNRIIDAENACPLGREWFNVIPRSEATRDLLSSAHGQPPGRDSRSLASLGMTGDALGMTGDALGMTDVAEAATLLNESVRPLVYLAPDITCEAQREAAAIADLLRARLDTVTSATALPFVIAAQERGFASATFGEIRNRADVVVFWGIDVAGRYPRFESRYAPEPAGIHGPGGRRVRRVIAVDVGGAVSTATDVDHRVSITAADEVAVLANLQAIVRQPDAKRLPLAPQHEQGPSTVANEIAPLLLDGRYVALVFDAEVDDREPRSSQRFDTLLGLSHALNERARCAAVALRGGGNRSGADSVLTAQTGYPLGVDFARGYPRYDLRGSATDHDVVLIVGNVTRLPHSVRDGLARATTIAVGPSANTLTLGEAVVRIDTGVAGIHEAGTAFRADDVPLPLRAPLDGGRSTAEVMRSIARLVSATRGTPVRHEPAPAQ